MVCTIECALGSSPKKPKPCNCSSDPVLQRYGAMNCGSHGVAIDQAAALASTQQVNDSGNEFFVQILAVWHSIPGVPKEQRFDYNGFR